MSVKGTSAKWSCTSQQVAKQVAICCNRFFFENIRLNKTLFVNLFICLVDIIYLIYLYLIPMSISIYHTFDYSLRSVPYPRNMFHCLWLKRLHVGLHSVLPMKRWLQKTSLRLSKNNQSEPQHSSQKPRQGMARRWWQCDLRSSEIFWDLLRSSEIFWDLLRSSEIFWDLLRWSPTNALSLISCLGSKSQELPWAQTGPVHLTELEPRIRKIRTNIRFAEVLPGVRKISKYHKRSR